jgi:hypothetical protein
MTSPEFSTRYFVGFNALNPSCSQTLQTKNSCSPPLHSRTDLVWGRVTGDLKSVRGAYGRFWKMFKPKNICITLHINQKNYRAYSWQLTSSWLNVSWITSHLLWDYMLGLV